jgi:16S rRNA G966 N2-methylase RsmD
MRFHRLANLFPLLEGDEFDSLVADVAQNGLNEPIWTYEDAILDGRNRYRACQKAKLEPRYRPYKGGAPVAFVIGQNIQRRDLTASQKAMLALVLMPELEAEAKGRMAQGGKGTEKIPDLGEAREKAAAAVGVNPRYVQDAKAVQEADPKLADKVRQGEMTLSEAKSEVKKRERKATREKEAKDAPLASKWSGDWQPDHLYVADITDHQFVKTLPKDSVDLVFSDPPWEEKSFSETYNALGAIAARCLKPGGFAAVYCGKMFLPEALHILTQHLDYVWTFGIFQPDSNDKINRWHLFSAWRPVALLKRPGEKIDMPWVPDMLQSTRSKSHHPWEQGIEPVLKIIEAYTVKGELVLDPMVGGGTMLTAAKKLDRRYIGFDIDERAVAVSTKRLSG